ncbi:MAG TPA: hypothetical protein ENH43_02625 [Phycisphaerales bacterium]|nr:hypothetical protein [Phycisphaerales bacterium]
MPNVVTIVTGPIVGLKSSWFLKDTVDFAAQLGKEIVVYNLIDEILEQADRKPKNAYEHAIEVGELLDGYQYLFELLRKNAYLSIARKIDKLPKSTNVIVRTHATIEWRGINIEFKDHRTIAEVLQPDRIITLIDAEWKIMEHLKSDYGQHVLRVVAQQKELSLERILRWLACEVSRSEDWAEWATHVNDKDVRHYVLGIETPSLNDRKVYVRDVDNMMKFATEKVLPTFYASYSMTVATDQVRKDINDMIWRLRHFGVVIDPASIEIEQNIESDEEAAVFAYTVCRDLRWDVQKVDIVAAFHPYTEMPPMSTGMLDELGHARAFGTERYLVMPSGAGSPFTRDNYVPANHLYKDGDSFFNFIEKKRRPTLKPRFADSTEKFGEWQEQATARKKD